MDMEQKLTEALAKLQAAETEISNLRQSQTELHNGARQTLTSVEQAIQAADAINRRVADLQSQIDTIKAGGMSQSVISDLDFTASRLDALEVFARKYGGYIAPKPQADTGPSAS